MKSQRPTNTSIKYPLERLQPKALAAFAVCKTELGPAKDGAQPGERRGRSQLGRGSDYSSL